MTTIFDLAAKPFDVELKHPVDNSPLGVSITIVGKNSRKFKDAFYQSMNSVEKQGKDLPVGDKLALAEKSEAELISKCVVGWSSDEFFGVYSPEAALDLLMKPEFSWIVKQLDEAIADETHFFSTSVPTS